MRNLAKLGFIDIKPGQHSELGYALLWSPYDVIKRLEHKRPPGFPTKLYTALLERAIRIGANDLDDAEPSHSQVVEASIGNVPTKTKK